MKMINAFIMRQLFALNREEIKKDPQRILKIKPL